MADNDRRGGGGGGGGYNSKKRRYRGEFTWNLCCSFTFRPHSRGGLLGPATGSQLHLELATDLLPSLPRFPRSMPLDLSSPSPQHQTNIHPPLQTMTNTTAAGPAASSTPHPTSACASSSLPSPRTPCGRGTRRCRPSRRSSPTAGRTSSCAPTLSISCCSWPSSSRSRRPSSRLSCWSPTPRARRWWTCSW